MAEALVLDSEALNAIANWSERGALAGRSRAILALAMQRGSRVRVPAPVLAEVCRGPRFDAAINHALKARGIVVEDLTEAIARRAGAILSRGKFASAHAIDAFVVATAAEYSTAVIATGDISDFATLITPYKHIRLFGI
jgi:predicted nucleic acid-binding protein